MKYWNIYTSNILFFFVGVFGLIRLFIYYPKSLYLTTTKYIPLEHLISGFICPWTIFFGFILSFILSRFLLRFDIIMTPSKLKCLGLIFLIGCVLFDVYWQFIRTFEFPDNIIRYLFGLIGSYLFYLYLNWFIRKLII